MQSLKSEKKEKKRESKPKPSVKLTRRTKTLTKRPKIN